MFPAGEYNGALVPQRQEFNNTHWSVVLAARGESSQAQEALETLCRVYWYPLYAFVRRQGHSPNDAEDLVQGFFARLRQRKDLETVQRERGRFCSYLLVSFNEEVAHTVAAAADIDDEVRHLVAVLRES